MATVALSPVFNAYQAFTVNGIPLNAGTLATYVAGSSTPVATYTTSSGAIANPTTITLGADGRPPNEVWIVQGTAVKFVLSDSSANVIGTYDNISGVNDFNSGTYLANSTGAVARTFNSKLGDFVSVKDFGAVGDGSTDDSTAFAAAIAAATADTVIYVPKTSTFYKLNSALTLANGAGARLVGIGKPTLKFYTLGSTTDCVTVIGASYVQSELRNLIIDCNSVGRDGVVLQAGNAPIWENVTVKNTVRDGYSFQPSGSQWISSGSFKQILGQTIGRHGFKFYLSGAGGAFINECEFQRAELRGISQVTAGANAIYASSDASSGASSMNGMGWIDCNWDAQSLAGAAKCGDNAVRIAYSTQPVRATGWKILGGGWEDTNANANTSGNYIYVETSAAASGWFVTGISPSGWCQYFSTTNSPTQSVLIDGNQGSFRFGGSVLSPGASRFAVYQTAAASNVTGDGTTYAIGSGGVTVNYDEHTDVSGSGVFTAPYTGKYRFTVTNLTMTGLGAAHTYALLGINVPAGSFTGFKWMSAYNAYGNSSGGNAEMGGSVDLALNAGDTCYPVINIAGGAKTVGIQGGFNNTSIFSGSLLG